VPRRRHGGAVLDASADRGARPEAAPDAPEHRVGTKRAEQDELPGPSPEGRLLASLESDAGGEHRPRQAARGDDPRGPALAPPPRPGVYLAPASEPARALRRHRGGRPDPGGRGDPDARAARGP